MADFVQTMKDWARMCDSMQGGIAKCDNCPLFKVLCQYRPNEKANLAVAEKIIEKWAEDNPEPVYPTWAEWLGRKVVGVDADSIYEAWHVLCKTRISADIAEKLGIEPKEG